MAQIVEEISVLTADHRRDKPRTITRPGELGAARTAEKAATHGGLLTAAKARMRVIHV